MKTRDLWNPPALSSKDLNSNRKQAANLKSSIIGQSPQSRAESGNFASLSKKEISSKKGSFLDKRAQESKENMPHLANLLNTELQITKKSAKKKIAKRRAAEDSQVIFEEFNESQEDAVSNHRFSDIYKPSKFVTTGEEEQNRRISMQLGLIQQNPLDALQYTQNFSTKTEPSEDKSPLHKRFTSLAVFPQDRFLSQSQVTSRKTHIEKQPDIPNKAVFRIERAQTEEDEYRSCYWRESDSFWNFQQQYKTQKFTIQQKLGDDGDCCDISISPKHTKSISKIQENSVSSGITPFTNSKRFPSSSIGKKTPIQSIRSRYAIGLDSTFQLSSSISSEEFKNAHHPSSMIDLVNKQGISPKAFPTSGRILNLRLQENHVLLHNKPDFNQIQMPECRSVSTHITKGDVSCFLGDESFDFVANTHRNHQDVQGNLMNSHTNHSSFSALRGINLNCEESIDQIMPQERLSNMSRNLKNSSVANFITKMNSSANTTQTTVPTQHRTLEEQLEDFNRICSEIENETDIFRECLDRSEEYVFDPFYFHTKQKEINPKMRSVLIDWMMEVSAEFYLKRDTLYLAQCYIDLYLASTVGCKKSELQLVGVTCLFMASKIEEVIPRKIKDFARATDDGYTISQIIEMEQSICKALKWRLNPITLNYWLNFYTHQWDRFVETSPFVDEMKMISPEKDLIKFREMSESSYFKYREIAQIVDLVILNVDFLQHDPQALIFAIMYLIIGREIGQFTGEEIVMDIPNSSVFLLADREGFHKVFGAFIRQYIDAELADLLELIQRAAVYFNLTIDFNLPLAISKNKEKAMKENYEELLTYQTHNPKSLETVRAIMAAN